MIVPSPKPPVLPFPSSLCSSPSFPTALALLSPTVPALGLTWGKAVTAKRGWRGLSLGPSDHRLSFSD